MVETNQNPLFKHFRQPAIYIKLPSRGKYWPEGSLDLPTSGEIPVYPMTTQDEIALRTPDALMNGTGVVSVIQSCCPNIKNAWYAPSIDMDALLIAVRIASYGSDMDVDADCPECKESNRYSIDLSKALDSIQPPDYDEPLTIDDLKFKLQPQVYEETNRTNSLDYEEQRILNAINDSNITPEEKARIVSEQMKKLSEITISLLAKSTAYIDMSDGTRVDQYNYIEEFYRNAQATIIRKLQEKVADLAKDVSVKPYQVKCNQCQHDYEMSINFDYSSFFAVGF